MTITHKTIAAIKAYQAIGIQYYAPDFKQWIDWLANTISSVPAMTNIPIFYYSQATGLFRVKYNTFEQSDILAPVQPGQDPVSHYLKEYLNYQGKGIFIMTDLDKYFFNTSSNSYHKLASSYLRTITTIVEQSQEISKRLIFLSEKIDLEADLLRLVPILDFPLPNQISRENTIAEVLAEKEIEQGIEVEKIAKAAAGLTLNEIEDRINNYYFYRQQENKEFNNSSLLESMTEYKTSLLKKLKIEVANPKQTQFGGHEVLRKWLQDAYQLMQPQISEEYGLPKYKGCLLAGVSGCGKTLVAETIAHEWNLPLIKLSIPSLKGGLVGQSENNLKNALKLIENIEGIVLIDEIEKAIGGRGTDSSGVSDGMLSILLDWMNAQENQFVIATANDVTRLPSEVLRSGRMNERWFVDLPGTKARKQILEIHLYQNSKRVEPKYKKSINDYLLELVDRTQGFSGAELQEIVLRGLRQAVIEGRPRQPMFKDFVVDLPAKLSESHPEQHKAIVAWGKNARPTSLER